MNTERLCSRWGQVRGLRDVGSNLPSSAFYSCLDQARPLLKASLPANGHKMHTERNPSPCLLKMRCSRSHCPSVASRCQGKSHVSLQYLASAKGEVIHLWGAGPGGAG